MMMLYVTYRRVSTDEQGKSGLGLEGQKSTLMHFLNGHEPLDDFVEIQSGKESDNRPQLQRALEKCRATGATLLVAKLDRLSRDTHFITGLQKRGYNFQSADMPNPDEFMTQIYAAVAQQERKRISERTKEALQAAKARGIKLGGKRWEIPAEQQQRVSEKAALMKKFIADSFAERTKPVIESLQQQGLNLSQIARTLEETYYLTASGKTKWSVTSVKNILNR